jgi:dimethylargininase
MPKLAITREPGDAYHKCISCHPLRHTIDIRRAREQHAAYRRALRELGLEVIEMPRDDRNADSCFVEDTAVVHGARALICRPAKESRRGEVGPVEEMLKRFLRTERASDPATVEGGDVIHLRDRLVSGVTERTNREGVRQMADWLDVKVDTVEDPRIMHLKSYATYLGRDTVVATEKFAKHPVFSGIRVIVLPDDQAYAADTLTIGDTVLMAKGYPAAHELVRRAGFEVVVLETSEFAKCDGALTCLSIII